MSQRDFDDAYPINAALDIHADDPAFGYRLIADDCPAHGIAAGPNRIARLCAPQPIWSMFAKKRALTRRAGPPVHDDLVQRRFTAAAPNQLWLTDITEHPTAEGKLYLCAIKGMRSGRIVGYSHRLADESLIGRRGAVQRHPAAEPRPPRSCTRTEAAKFRSTKIVKALHRDGLVNSMGRVGACGDNAAMESFFALLQRHVLDRQR